MSTPENENAVPPFSFTPQADIASYLERLCELTGAARDDVMDELLRPVLNQIFEEGQGEPLEKFFQLYEYDDQNEALEAVRRYDAFVRNMMATTPRPSCAERQRGAGKSSSKPGFLTEQFTPKPNHRS